MRTAIISAHPAPYRDRFLSRLSCDKRFNIDIYTEFPDDGKHIFGASDEYPSCLIAKRSDLGVLIFWRFLRMFVLSRKYDFVMWPCYVHWYERLAILVGICLGRRYGFGADSVSQPKINYFAWIVKKIIVRNAELIHVPGGKSKEFFEATFSVKPNKVIEGAYAMDGDELERRIIGLRDERVEELRKAMDIGEDNVVFLMAANMTRTRRYDLMCSAFKKFVANSPSAIFIACGSGPELEEIRKEVANHQNFRIVPGCGFDELLNLYAISNVYVHGGKEPASTALVLGAIANLPLVSSKSVGCTYDVLMDGESGVIVDDYESEEQWIVAFNRIMSMRDQWGAMGKAARVFSRKLDFDKAYEQYCMALQTLQEGGL